MKKSPLIPVLVLVLALSAVTSVVLCWSFISKARELRTLQQQVAMINNNRAFLTALATDALEYSKKNPAIDPILESVGVKPGKSAPAAPASAPALKPATK